MISTTNGKSSRAIRAAGFAGLGIAIFSSVAQPRAQEMPWRIAQAAGPFRSDVERGGEIAQVKCASCHGADGNSASVQIPKLAGQNPDYLYEQLSAFHAGTRQSPAMSAIATDLPARDAAAVASYYAAQRRKPDPEQDRTLAAAGERIFIGVENSSMMSRCVSCHGAPGQAGGMDGTGMGMMGGSMMGMGMGGGMAAAPDLSGQHAAYTLDQLNRFVSGERQGQVMNPIAASLSAGDRKAVAEYLSSVP